MTPAVQRPNQEDPAARPASRYRLRGARAFERVFATGRRHDAHFLQLIAAAAAQSPGRVGYVIGRKMIRRAVDRNRLRRLLRENVRAARPHIEAFDVIVRVKRGVTRAQLGLAGAESRDLFALLAASQ